MVKGEEVRKGRREGGRENKYRDELDHNFDSGVECKSIGFHFNTATYFNKRRRGKEEGESLLIKMTTRRNNQW